jgi:protein-disulfide isomerase
MNTNGNTKRLLTWGSFIIVIILIIWGLVAASNKAKKEEANLAPVDQVTSDDWISSTTTTPVTLIEYGDFQCPACAAYFPLVERLLSENPNQVRLVFRHFPLSQHANAVPASKAAEAAGRQGKFWEMYRELYSTQAEWENIGNAAELFTQYAQKLGLDMEKYVADVKDPAIDEKINNSIKSGYKAGVNSTPTFYVNGNKIPNPQSYEEFKSIIDKAVSSNP